MWRLSRGGAAQAAGADAHRFGHRAPVVREIVGLLVRKGSGLLCCQGWAAVAGRTRGGCGSSQAGRGQTSHPSLMAEGGQRKTRRHRTRGKEVSYWFTTLSCVPGDSLHEINVLFCNVVVEKCSLIMKTKAQTVKKNVDERKAEQVQTC